MTKCALFDFDGVIVDTEPLYDIFWNEAGERYGTGIPDFAAVIKGTTLPNILKKYFGDRTEEFRQMVIKESTEYESKMELPEMPGSINFVKSLKENGVKTALVTSSDREKVNRAFRELGIEVLFDVVVTSDLIEHGKPDPSCYLLAASKLNVKAEDCIVFEDSFAGIQAGTAAGARVIALSTTNPAETLKDKAYKVIPNFEKFSFKDYCEWCI